jgi:hypothetical protein
MTQQRTRRASTLAQLAIPENEFFEPFNAIHRDESAFVGFARKTGESVTGIENLFSLTRKQVNSMLPEIAQWLVQDAYMTVNGYNSTAPYNVRKTGLPGVWRKEKNLRCLNAVYADLDINRIGENGPRGMDLSSAFQLLIDLTSVFTGASGIPQYSIIAQSGRGLYVLWLLRDDDDENAPVTFKNQKTFAEQKALYKVINRAVYNRLDCLAADKICDAARLLRVPGTRHNVTGEKCGYHVFFNADDKLNTYTLNELAAAFGVPVMKSSLPVDVRKWQANENPINPKKANGAKALAMARAHDLVILEQFRGGWQKGRRRFSLRLYAQFLRSAGTSYTDATRAVELMAGNCIPPYPSDADDEPLNALLRNVWHEPFATVRQENLAKWLQVTPELARELELEKIVPVEIADERRQPKGGERATAKAARLQAIETIIQERGMLSVREFASELQAQDMDASKATVQRDLIALGLQDSDARKKAGRPSEQMTLPES